VNNQMSFIEKQFPVSKLSKESYKERKANNGQTLTGLGKWWGRKPLILVRAAILGCLMPCSEKPKADMEIFLKYCRWIMTVYLTASKNLFPLKSFMKLHRKVSISGNT